ncbi:MAG TPA: hypothetical protein VNA69_05065 [Thermoanaerobaculia bacterium]|nr:hypothetical protein [Thermoanaerobaculia bacterium]
MDKPRIFLGSSGKQEKLLQALTRGLEDVAHVEAPQLDGTGEIRVESADRADGYFTTHSDTHPKVNTRTSGVYLRADPEDLNILDGRGNRQRAELIAERLRDWKSITNV